ncbi:MAG TPA: hypothetical protein VN653_10800 [Anaerolineales bacterium]|nr:hypothetical protein [Anaerolineales bacterium]
MNMRESRVKIKPERWQFLNLKLLLTAILVLTAVLAIVFGVRAVETMDLAGGSLLKVPGEYTTIQAAINAANSGDIIEVKPGIYKENITLDKPVSLTAETFDQINPTNNQTIIDGSGGTVVIRIPGGLTQMPSIRGFVIRNATDGILANSPFIAEYNFVYAADNLVSYQIGGGGINRNNVYFHAAANAIRLDHMDRPLLIENNRILYSGADGIEVSLQNTPIPPAPIEINIWNNMILGNGDDGIQVIDHPGEPQDTNRRFTIAGNLIANNIKAGLGLMPNANTLEDYSGANIAEAVRVYNNTFYGNNYGISGGANLVAFNNIFANSPTRAVWRVSGPTGSNAVVAYSLFHNNRMDADQASLGAGNILGVDPLFEAAPNPGPDGTWLTVDDDFSGLVLQSGSPAIDKGVAQYIANNGEPIPPSPLAGFTGAAPDLGWRELGSPIFVTPTPTALSSSTSPATATVETQTPLPTPTTLPGSPSPTAITATPASPTATSGLATPTAASTSTQIVTTTPTPQLTIQLISPNVVQINSNITANIVGSGFQSGAIVTFEGGQGLPPEVLAVQVVDSTTITLTVNTQNPGVLSLQVWDVRITNPDNSTAILPDAFTVIPIP